MKSIILGAVIVAVAVVGYVVFRPESAVAPTDTPTPTVSRTPATGTKTPTPTPVPATPTPSGQVAPSATPTPTPTPGIIIRETAIHRVTIENFKFSPTPLTVVQGDIVIFKNLDGVVHTATALNKLFDSKNLRQNDEWTLTTANLAVGTYEYQCTPHPSMRGTLIVQAP